MLLRHALSAAAIAAAMGLGTRAASAQPAAPTAPIEVTVEGEKAPAGSTSLGRRDIREMPGVLDDPFRAIEVQPGVIPAASGIPYYFIRGAPPGNIGTFFDGISVPMLFHVGGGPSVIPAPMIRRVELHPGPVPVSAGRFAGAVVEAESTPPPFSWRGDATLRVTDIGGFAEGPVGDRVSVMAGGRYSVGTSIIPLIFPGTNVTYGDYQGRITWKPTEEETISVIAFGSRDYLASFSDNPSLNLGTLVNSDFHRLDLRYERAALDGEKVTAAITLGLDRSRDIAVKSARDLKLDARMSWSRPLSIGGAVRAGLDAAIDRYDVTPFPKPYDQVCPFEAVDKDNPNPPPPKRTHCTVADLDEAGAVLFPSRLDLALGAWADATLPIGDRATLTPGLRVDHYASMGKSAIAVDPRITGRFRVSDHVRLVPAVALASQLPGFAPLPALQIGGIPGGLQRSLQTSFGAELKFRPIEAVATVFRQVTFNLTDAIGTLRGSGFDADRFLSRSRGDSYGLEIGARGALRKDMFFVASYTLSRSTRTKDGLTVPSAYDRTHIAQLALLFNVGRGVRLGVRHMFYTGFPADEVTAGRPPSPHPDRVRPFYRFDFRASKRWKLGSRSYIELALDIQNATLAKEVYDVDCSKGTCQPVYIGPLSIPSLTLEAGF